MNLYAKQIKNLDSTRYDITQNKGTESAFNNEYWDNKEEGVYVDIISGEPLFASIDKYDSGTGWPSFTKALEEESLILKDDLSHGLTRTEVATETCHLGHLFKDGPKDKGGNRYCVNSASLKFIPKDELIKSGYGDYLKLFSKQIDAGSEKAYLAGGCFWGLEHFFNNTSGVIDTNVGYSGGNKENPSYEEISCGNTGHAETVEILFNPQKINYRRILKLFFKVHDSTSINRQGNDIGTQYRSIIFYVNQIQKYIALNIIERVNMSGVFQEPIVTEVLEFKKFYKAEEYHQKYLQNNPQGYNCHRVREEWDF